MPRHAAAVAKAGGDGSVMGVISLDTFFALFSRFIDSASQKCYNRFMGTPEFSSEKFDRPSPAAATPPNTEQSRSINPVPIVIGVIVVLVLLGVAIYFLLQPATPTDKIRDIFIIIVALESLLIGVALIVMIVQLASLINLLQNEVKPILHATNETVNTLRGTAEFLGESVVEPVIKLNGYLAGMNRMLELMGIRKK
jgi:hypothetical protein